MPEITRLGDMTAGHDGFPPRPSIEASEDVFVEGIGAVRVGDAYAIHCNSTPTCHDGRLAEGSSTVFVNGKPVGRVGDPVDCGDTVAFGATTVFCG